MSKRVCESCEDLGYDDVPAELILEDWDGGEMAVCGECYHEDAALDGSCVVDVTVIGE